MKPFIVLGINMRCSVSFENRVKSTYSSLYHWKSSAMSSFVRSPGLHQRPEK